MKRKKKRKTVTWESKSSIRLLFVQLHIPRYLQSFVHGCGIILSCKGQTYAISLIRISHDKSWHAIHTHLMVLLVAQCGQKHCKRCCLTCSKYFWELKQKANIVEETRLQCKWTLENINIQHLCNTSVSYIKSSIIFFENFYVCQKFFSIFIKLVAFPRKPCCLHKPIEYVFAFSNYLF